MDLVLKILRRLAVSKSQRHFLESLLMTILVTRGKITFRNLSRYSDVCERTYSRHFAQPMDWVGLNRQVIDATFGPDGQRGVFVRQSRTGRIYDSVLWAWPVA